MITIALFLLLLPVYLFIHCFCDPCTENLWNSLCEMDVKCDVSTMGHCVLCTYIEGCVILCSAVFLWVMFPPCNHSVMFFK
jgi:hypothetical protein